MPAIAFIVGSESRMELSCMEDVALHLQSQAIALAGSDERDRFGRSAYNRYYYATFLLVRAMLEEMDASWSRLPHATYPAILKGQVLRTLKNARRTALRVGDSELIGLCGQAISATQSLSDLMNRGSATRVIADYEPDIRVVFGANRFSLQGININDAHDWPPKARSLISVITKCWSQIHA